ncbi:hypothetical protein NVP1187O_006 [Vibrio phage 1.187.O._10N.286.49.F1]|nr:hypothetical protein NVP1187O_006 [Vibrio phage 1.187.O._10N.286.49.F1]
MKTKLLQKLLTYCVRQLYSTDKQRADFKRKVNNETWISSQIGSGGHSLMASRPICNEEVVSIMCVLCDNRTYIGDDDKTIPVDYYRSEWKG